MNLREERFPAAAVDPEEIERTLSAVRDRAGSDPAVSAGCVVAVGAMIALIALPFVARALQLPSAALWVIGGVLGLLVLAGSLLSIFGGGFVRGSAIADVEEAVEQLVDAFPDGDPAVMREAAVRILDQSIISSGPTSVAGFDQAKVSTRLGDALQYVVVVEKILLEQSEIYPCFTQWTPDDVTDIWFRTDLPLMDIARGMGLADPSEDAEDYWEWVIGRAGRVEVDIARTHRRPAGVVDTRLFLVSGVPIRKKLEADLLERLRRVVHGAIWCGRWIYRSGNDFDLVVVEEHPPGGRPTVTRTLLTPCRVPWMVGPSTSALRLTHMETDTEPRCSVVLGGGRMSEEGQLDNRRIEIDFELCHHTRTLPLGGGGVSAIYPVEPDYEGDMSGYLDWLRGQWKATGLCPRPGFYVATESEWLSSLEAPGSVTCHQYVVVGRDGYIELIADRYRWREWLWTGRGRDDLKNLGPVVGSGEGA